MSNPRNEFSDFFSKPVEEIRNTMKPPTVEQVVNALCALVAENPKFYEDEKLRLMVCKGMSFCSMWMVDELAKGRRPDLHLGYAAFMMMLGDRMESTYEEFAGDTERRMYNQDAKELPDEVKDMIDRLRESEEEDED